jgi:hypothetical protein
MRRVMVGGVEIKNFDNFFGLAFRVWVICAT